MTTPNTAELRTWARANGYEVGERGRVSTDVVDAFRAAKAGGSVVTGATASPQRAAKPAVAKASAKSGPTKRTAKSPAKRSAARSATAPAKRAASGTTAAAPRPVTGTGSSRNAPTSVAAARPAPRVAQPTTPSSQARQPEPRTPLAEAPVRTSAPAQVAEKPAVTAASEDHAPRIEQLTEQLRALESRIAKLEQQGAAAPRGLFGRRRS